MPHFFLKLIAPRPTFAMGMNEAEKKMMQEYRMGVIEAVDEAAARAIAANDPAVKANGGLTCEIHPMRAVTRETVN